jgi:hypothetical protein
MIDTGISMNPFYSVCSTASIPFIKTSTKSLGFVLPATPAKNPLGISTKSQSSPENIRSQRYLLQDQSAKLLPKERVCNCLKKRIDKTKNRSVKYNESRKKAHYANVQRCGSVWSCPVCAAQITEKRRIELQAATERWKTVHSGAMFLLTLTNSHNASHSLQMLKSGQKKAMAYFFGDREGKRLFALLGRKHHITNYEVTHGDNGWHPHHHILLFAESALSPSVVQSIRDALARHWINCCAKAGLPLPNMTHGLDLVDGSYADQYVSKWGIEQNWGLEHEMTKGHVKKGKQGGLTPFDLLRLSFDDAKYGKLFQEFVLAFKGSRQLMWSRGLKALLLIFDQADEDLAQETEKDAIELCEVQALVFSLLCRYQKRSDYLTCLENDYQSGNFGATGEAQALLNNLILLEMERFRCSSSGFLPVQEGGFLYEKT